MLTDIGAAALLIAVFWTNTKFLLGYLVSPTSPNQNNITRLYVFAVAILIVVGTDWAYNALQSRGDVITAVKFALSSGAVAIASYHLLASDALPSVFPPLAPSRYPDPAPAEVVPPSP